MYHEKFTTRRELAETLSEELDCASDEMTVYVDDWYAYKNEAYTDLAESMLEYSGIDVVGGKIVCNDKSSITIYAPSTKPRKTI